VVPGLPPLAQHHLPIRHRHRCAYIRRNGRARLANEPHVHGRAGDYGDWVGVGGYAVSYREELSVLFRDSFVICNGIGAVWVLVASHVPDLLQLHYK
jgi:hypothetical protein